MKKVVIYARVSTKVQEYDRQLDELRQYADRMGYEIVREFSEKVSGAKKIEERAALSELLEYVEAITLTRCLCSNAHAFHAVLWTSYRSLTT